jgi:cytochrome c oxidase cbb3-type subunit 3
VLLAVAACHESEQQVSAAQQPGIGNVPGVIDTALAPGVGHPLTTRDPRAAAYYDNLEGRPNGMPAWGGKVPDEQLWQLATYVRSMSLPATTLAAQNGPTPSQTPAPVPRAADEDTGWAAPPGTTNDYTTTTEGPH